MREGSPFAGHSLGEYAALASVGDVLTIESLVDVTDRPFSCSTQHLIIFRHTVTSTGTSPHCGCLFFTQGAFWWFVSCFWHTGHFTLGKRKGCTKCSFGCCNYSLQDFCCPPPSRVQSFNFDPLPSVVYSMVVHDSFTRAEIPSLVDSPL